MNLDKNTHLSSHIFSALELDRAIKIAARVVVLYGEVYLPIFNRLHQEVVAMKEKKETESLVFKLAKSYAGLEEKE